jgi:hypothetical protein
VQNASRGDKSRWLSHLGVSALKAGEGGAQFRTSRLLMKTTAAKTAISGRFWLEAQECPEKSTT